ncbi:MAG: sterol desaturase family protein [Bacteroidetes bacterium]|jgi:sterol desaturase/sphingolipid hydroxylase (fatty acid hydroxylase superfamily)|nr:sterol desaturase family protein [Bacteroidota bacterium]MDF1867749.1 sterol desaturase family protein [Saprospiraceae bacterium]
MDKKMQIAFLVVFFGAIAIELVWSYFKKKQVYNFRESLANAFIIIGAKVIKPLTLAWGYYLFTWASQYKIAELPFNWYTILLTALVVEFVYYWYHRLSHEIPILWTIHHTHHSSPWLNFFTAGRLNWLGKFTSPVFYIPLVMVGFSPLLITGVLAISLIYQIFLHTEMIGKIGFFEGLFFNTPSAHRVHHASNKKYIDKNYGGMLIIFDRIFGTYVPETEKVDYGVTTGFIGHNPFKILFQPLFQYLKKAFGRKGHISEKQEIKFLK